MRIVWLLLLAGASGCVVGVDPSSPTIGGDILQQIEGRPCDGACCGRAVGPPVEWRPDRLSGPVEQRPDLPPPPPEAVPPGRFHPVPSRPVFSPQRASGFGAPPPPGHAGIP